jgi:membrane dipeptidase
MTNYKDLHQRAVVIDGHSDILFDMLCSKQRNEAKALTQKHLPILKKGGVNAIIAAVFTGYCSENPLRNALLEIGYLYEELRENPEIRLILSRKDIMQIKRSGALGIILSMEGLDPLGCDLTLLDVFYRLGVRCASLTWNNRNTFASGPDDVGGLSDLGKKCVTEMEQSGILIDVSHLNDEGFWDVIDLATKPVIASHSNARAQYPCRRNLTDEQIQAIVTTGGVIGINCYFTEEDQNLSLDSFIRHVEYMISIAGEDHVGLGPDFNWYLGDVAVPRLEDASKMICITEELCNRGYSDSTIYKILGENFLRVLNGIL